MNMRKQLIHYTRTSRLLCSAMFKMASDDPALFLEKVFQRLKLSPLRAGLKYVPSIPQRKTAVQRMFDEGELSALQEILASGTQSTSYKELSSADKHRVARASERLQLLEKEVTGVNTSSEIRTLQKSGAPCVLFYLTNSLPHTMSGYTYRSHNTLLALKQSGIRVAAMTRLAYPLVVGKWPKKDCEVVQGIPYFRSLPRSYPGSLIERLEVEIELLVEQAREFGADILHTTTDYNNALVVAEAARQLGIPWVYEARGELESTWLSKQPAERQEALVKSDFYQLARGQETACMKAANAVVALSEVSKLQLLDRGVLEKRITVVPNAVHEETVGLEFDQSSLRRELGLEDGVTVGTVTSVVGYEGLDVLLRAAASIPHVRVLIVGEGSARIELEILAKELRMSDRVLFVGRQPNESIWKWYAVLDAFVVPRRNTPVCRNVTPIKALQAQALGVPVIASDLPALREITGEHAQYFQPENPEELADCLSKLGGYDAEKIEAGKEWAKKHTWKYNARRYSKIYRELNTF
ncbi:hypothetical protein HMPREF2996_00350 [Corynebacterium sp. HMSC066C02]|nr:hypothetical protein HMPREF2996_00350 [Corynebacterium sp. HMSC066C02]